MKDKVVLVTGATSGIGRATAVLLAKKGAQVIIGARREELGQKLAAEIIADGGKAVFKPLDVTNEANIAQVVEEIVTTYGKLDMAVNNAGTAQPLVPITQIEKVDFEALFHINVTGVLLSMKHEMLAMQKHGAGSIVNTSSINGLKANNGSATYSASKFAVQALTQSAALEGAGQNIRVNAVAPGPTHSEITDQIPAEHRGSLIDSVPLKRMGEAEEVANGIAWLLSDESSFVTGATLVMDGGRIIND